MLRKETLVKCLASFFYVGYLPVSGTAASIFPVAVFFLLKANPLIYNIIAVLSMPIALAVSHQAQFFFQEKDPHSIVIDEISGMLITFLFIPFKWQYALAGFFLFRFFDIVKPYPIRRIEKLRGGWGIALDDIVAAAYANLALRIIARII